MAWRRLARHPQSQPAPHPNPDQCDTGEANDMEAAMSASSADYGAYPHDDNDVPVEELARRQGVRPIKSAAELVHPEVWETDEELDAFLADLDARRRAGASAS